MYEFIRTLPQALHADHIISTGEMVITVQWLLHFNYYYVKTSWYRYIHVEIPKNCKENLYAPSHKLDIVFIERVHAKEFKAWMFFFWSKVAAREKMCPRTFWIKISVEIRYFCILSDENPVKYFACHDKVLYVMNSFLFFVWNLNC